MLQQAVLMPMPLPPLIAEGYICMSSFTLQNREIKGSTGVQSRVRRVRP